MIAWYLDVLVGFLIRTVIRLVRILRSAKWPIERGAVASMTCPTAIVGGPVAEIGYTYVRNGEYYSGVHRKAFLLTGSAKDYVDQFVLGAQVLLRVNPAQPETSVFVE
jgi:hypothetical protein